MKFSLDSFCLTILILFSIIYLSFIYDQTIDFYDEGNLLYYTNKTMNGEVSFIDFITLFSIKYHLLAGVFWIFGKSIAVFRIAASVLRIINVILTYKCSRHFTDPLYSFLTALIYAVAPGPFHKTYFSFVILINFYILLKASCNKISALHITFLLLLNTYSRPIVSIFLNLIVFSVCFIAEKDIKKLFLYFYSYILICANFWTGIFIYLGILDRHYILFLLFNISFFILILPLRKHIFLSSVSRCYFIFTSCMITFVYLIYNPGIHSNVMFAAYNYSNADFSHSTLIIAAWFGQFLSSVVENSAVTFISNSYVHANAAVLFLAGTAIFIIFIMILIKLSKNIAFFTLFSFTTLLMLKFFQRMDIAHFLQSSVPVYILISLCFYRFSCIYKQKKIYFFSILLLISSIYSFWLMKSEYPLVSSISVFNKNNQMSEIENIKLKIEPKQKVEIEHLIKLLEKLCKEQDSFFTFPDATLFYFLLDKDSVFLDNLAFPVDRTEKFQNYMINEIFPLLSIKYCLYLKNYDHLWNLTFKQRYPVLFDYLTTSGQKVLETKSYIVYSLEWN